VFGVGLMQYLKVLTTTLPVSKVVYQNVVTQPTASLIIYELLNYTQSSF